MDLSMPDADRSKKPKTYLIRATRVSVQKIMLVAPMRSWWSGGSWKMLAKTYSGDVPTSPKMMPMALHGSIQHGACAIEQCIVFAAHSRIAKLRTLSRTSQGVT